MKHWENLKSFFDKISCNYVVLRNYEELSNIDTISDIDILTEDNQYFIKRMGIIPVGETDNGFNYFIFCNEQKIYIDLRYVGDNYYCQQWEADMLKNSQKEKYYFRLGNEDYAFSYYYHLLIHKLNIDYKRKKYLDELMKQIGKEKYSLQNLKDYMQGRKYNAVKPLDSNVTFNAINFQKL